MASPLADLDELVLKCRDEKALNYIREAVLCYKSGAFRSAIVSTWIAVSFDLIDKIRELSLTGDKAAEKQLDVFEKARKSGDIARSLKFERELLVVAKDEIELISHIEYLDLERLNQDRNRCAHPSMTLDGEIFNPTAELARVHIRNAVEHLLQYPPSQGKSALDKILSEVESEYFPTDEEKAVVALKTSPLYRARSSLVRNFTIVLLKKLLLEIEDYKERSRFVAALKGVESLHREIYEKTVTDKISHIIRSIPDESYPRLVTLIRRFPEFLQYFDDDVTHKLENYIENLPSEHVEELDDFLDYEKLSKVAEKRLNKLTRKEVQDTLFWVIHPKVSDKIISLYLESKSFDQANSMSKTVALYSEDYTKEQILELVRGSADNGEVKYSFGLSAVIQSLRKNKSIEKPEFESILEEVGLGDYRLSEDE